MIFFFLIIYLHFPVGLNQFSDMTFAEFKKSYLLTEPQVLFLAASRDQWGNRKVPRFMNIFITWQNCSATRGNHLSSNGPYPDMIDWRTKGHYVTDVKNQVTCLSCPNNPVVLYL